MKLIYALFLFHILIHLASCTKNSMEPAFDECDDKTQLNERIIDEYTNRTAAEIAYIYDPSIKNCNILKNAQESYLNAMEQLANCTIKAGQNSDLIIQIEDAREELKQLNCQ